MYWNIKKNQENSKKRVDIIQIVGNYKSWILYTWQRIM